MPTVAKEKRQDRLEDKEPAKGGTEKPKSKPYPSSDSPNSHGDPFKDDIKTGKQS